METSHHFLLDCSAFAKSRLKHLGVHTLEIIVNLRHTYYATLKAFGEERDERSQRCWVIK